MTPTPFKTVFEEELKWIRERRTNAEPARNGRQDVSHISSDLDLSQLQRTALNQDLCGLAISGGGIRSATFALGVLQGLASKGLLPRFDYMSTVSGGGYVGAWLSAWINRENPGSSSVSTIQNAITPTFERGERRPWEDRVEAAEISHLRAYGNYLAPIPGFFSTDGLVLIAIYLRNLLLNQLVLVLALIGLFVGQRGIVDWFAICRDRAFSNPEATWTNLDGLSWCVVLVPIALLICAFTGTVCQLLLRGRPKHFNNALFWCIAIVPWWLASVSAACLFSCKPALTIWLERDFATTLGETVGVSVVFHALLGFGAASFRRARSTEWFSGVVCATIAGIFAGAIAGSLFTFGWRGLLLAAQGSPASDVTIALAVTFGSLMNLAIFVLANFLTIGFARDSFDELSREWFSSFNARVLGIGISWFAFSSMAIFGPWLIGILLAYFGTFKFDRPGDYAAGAAGGAVGAGWIGTIVAGIRFAMTETSNTKQTQPFRTVITRIAPPLFLVTSFMGVAFLATWCWYDAYALLHKNENWQFLSRIGSLDLLSDLNDAKTFDESYGLSRWMNNVEFGRNLDLLILMAIVALGFLGCSAYVSQLIGANRFSLNHLYCNRLTRCYLGASANNRTDSADALTNFSPDDDLPLFQLETNKAGGGPYHIVNATLNQSVGATREAAAEKLQFQERKGESFTFAPLYCGWTSRNGDGAYVAAKEFTADTAPVTLGESIAVSGAAVSPNMGYQTSPSMAALMTVFNVRLGAWFRNPNANRSATLWDRLLFLKELLGQSSSDDPFVYLSDGGHFENMGVYELIRRRCRFVMAIDCGADPQFHENVGRLVRQVRIDFGILIEVDLRPVSPDKNRLCSEHMVVGRIHYEDVHPCGVKIADDDPAFYPRRNQGVIVWIKNSLTGDEPGDVRTFAAMDRSFPYDTTVNQFFSEPIFESYRALGTHACVKSLSFLDDVEELSNETLFHRIYDFCLQRPSEYEQFYADSNDKYGEILQRLGTEPALAELAAEIYGLPVTNSGHPSVEVVSDDRPSMAEVAITGEMFAVLENVWLTLDLDNQSNAPIYRGWINVCRNWKDSKRAMACWKETKLRAEFSPGFQEFMERI